MKVVYVLSTLERSGPVNQVFDLLTHLNRDRYTPEVVTLSTATNNSRSAEFESEGIHVHSLDLSRRETLTTGRSRLRSGVSERRPSVVHTHGIRSDLLAAITLDDYSTVCTVHNVPSTDYRLRYGSLQGRIMAITHSLAFSRIDAPVACSHSVSEALKTSTWTIRNGIDASNWTPSDPGERAEVRKRLGLPLDETVFLFVGPFIDRKRPRALISGFLESPVADSGRLVMVGDGPLHEESRQQVSGTDAVVLPGFVKSVQPYIAAADYYVSPSMAEGLPLGVLEALGSGLPVCLSDIPPHREILAVDPLAGVLFSNRDPTEIARGMTEITSSDHSRLSTAARGIVMDELNADRMAQEYGELYDSLAK